MSAVAVEQAVRPVRVILTEFVKHVVEGEDEINRDELIAYAVKRFEGDEEFRVAAARDSLALMVPEVLKAVIHQMRGDFVATPTGAKRRSAIEETARERFAKVFEGSGVGYRNFLVMRKNDLLRLNERDEKNIATQLKWVALRHDFASRMNDTQTVGDTFNGVQLEEVWNRHFNSDQPETSR